MASEGSNLGGIAGIWEKILLVVAAGILVACAVKSFGYFKIDKPKLQVDRLEEEFRIKVSSPTVPEAPPALDGKDRVATLLEYGSAAPRVREWISFNYPGSRLVVVDPEEEKRFGLPVLGLEAEVVIGSGDVNVSWRPTAETSFDLPPPGTFELRLYRWELADGPDARTLVSKQMSFSDDLTEILNEPIAGSDAEPLRPGRTYVWQMEMEIAADVKLQEEAVRTGVSEEAVVTTPARFELVRLIKGSQGKKAVDVELLAEDPIPNVPVKHGVIRSGGAIPVPEEHHERVGRLFPFRAVKGTGWEKAFRYYDLQKSFFGVLFRVSSLGGPPPGAPPGGQEKEGDSGTEPEESGEESVNPDKSRGSAADREGGGKGETSGGDGGKSEPVEEPEEDDPFK